MSKASEEDEARARRRASGIKTLEEGLPEILIGFVGFAMNPSVENRSFEALRPNIYDGREGLLHKWELLVLP